ncbi:hypothetical protein KM043_011481 [Ampulex compressa]|nr:hypothetical protein KM043_011481 [Ampulex compressa]
MSWFDAAGFANLAKSALKEAQRTIDKALDIKEEQKVIPTHTQDTSDFFATWGLKNDESVDRSEKDGDQKQDTTSSSIWGSFTGSFFETPKLTEEQTKNIKQSKSLQSTPVDNVQKHQLVSSISLPDDYRESIGHNAPDLSKEPNLDIATTSNDQSLPTEVPVPSIDETDKTYKNISVEVHTEKSFTSNNDTANSISTEKDDGTSRTDPESDRERTNEREINTSHTSNRISIISSESDKKSLESVEILGSRSDTDCTTTPESDVNSFSNSISPSAMGPKINSESVEILPDSSVTSPSSVEILGDWKSDSSPFLSPLEPKNSETPLLLEKDEPKTPMWDEICAPGITSKHNESDTCPYETKADVAQTSHMNSDAIALEIDDLATPLWEDMDTMPIVDKASDFGSHMQTAKVLYSDSDTDGINSTPSSNACTLPLPNRNLSNPDYLKVYTESDETVPEVDESDEISLAEDSYTSASESTVMTIMETYQQLEQTKSKIEFSNLNAAMHDSCSDGKQFSTKASTEVQLNLSLDSMKEKHNLHLPLEAITTQPVRKPEYHEPSSKKTDLANFDRLMSTTIEPAESDTYTDVHSQKISEIPECTEQHLILTDSSCEGTLIESSSEDNATLICKTEPKIIEAPLSTSSYVKTMLADAMVEKSEAIDVEGNIQDMPRENSPISSESRSDLVKIGSDQTSGHTSGDELETTTSSDIEIISSPNGDSSSTQSRQSPAKLQPTKGGDLLTKTLKTRGHSRELSEISVGSDEANSEIEKLLKRVQEMTEILEARESKLIDVSRMNLELHEQNSNLKKQLDNFEKHVEQNQNLNQITDEYTQRLSALERKFQQAIRERDTLRKNLEHLKAEAATRLSSQEMSNINAEKDEIIKELREEGEKLSKQQLQHSNIIKKLRAKEKENDGIIKSQKDQIEEQNSELERLKRSLHAKEEVERTQIEAVHTLTAKTKKQEKEILILQEKLDNTTHKMEAYKKSLDVAKVDLAETKAVLITIEADLKEATENAGESCQLFAQVEDLKLKLRQAEEAYVKKEEFLKQENGKLLKRLEAEVARSEKLSESVSMAAKPLLRQIEQLHTNLSHKSNSFMKQEKELSEKNMELEAKVENLIEMDRYLKEENVNLKSSLSQLESKLSSKETEHAKLQELYDKLIVENEKLAEENLRHQQIIETLEQSHSNRIKELKRDINALENKLAVEKAATDAERRKNLAILEQQQQSIDEELRLSPTASIDRESVSSVNSIWPVFGDSVLENTTGRYPISYESIRAGSSSTIFENLQAQLKQREGEIQHLQWALSRRNTERDALTTELSTLTLKIEELNNKVTEAQALNENLAEIQTRYDALLQMYGEKVEENQELRLDLEDVKDMYKTQIDQLLKRDT